MDDNWIDRYFYSIQLQVGLRKQPKYLRSEIIKNESIDLDASLKMFSQESSCTADNWTNVNIKYDDRRSFPRFLELILISGLDKYAFSKDIISNLPPNRWLLPLQTSPDNDVVIADKYYGRSLSLIQLLRRIRSGHDDFRREQANLLESFLDPLIKIQEEQRLVAYGLSDHLEKLRKSGAVSLSSDAVDADDRDRHKCSVHIQKHLFDSLYIMSRESAWLLKRLNDSYFASPSFIKECNKILDIILDFISKFKESRELLDQNPVELVMVQNNEKLLYDFGERIKNLQEQGVERKSIAETLLGCFEDVLNMFYKSKTTCSSSSLECASFSEAAKQTSELINEAVEKLMSVRCSDLIEGGSPLGCIVLWRILFESSLVNLRLDLICDKHNKTVDLGVKQLDAATRNNQLDQIRVEISKLLIVGESVLGEFVAMQKTVAEVTYTLGDAFITGGAGMRGSSYPGTSSKLDDQVIMDFNVDDFPWDKHTVSVSNRWIGIDDIPRNIYA